MSTITRDHVLLHRVPIERRGQVVGVRYWGECTRCGATSPHLSTAGMVSGWSARHRMLDRDARPSELCPGRAS